MADIKSTTAVPPPSDQEENHHQPINPLLGFFSNFLKLFNLPLPFLPPPPAKTNQPEELDRPVAVGEAQSDTTKPAVVKFPPPAEENLPSLKLEPDEVVEQNTNPVVLWQVYAIGGFLVLRWAWTRWNERKDRKKPSDGNPPPAAE